MMAADSSIAYVTKVYRAEGDGHPPNGFDPGLQKLRVHASHTDDSFDDTAVFRVKNRDIPGDLNSGRRFYPGKSDAALIEKESSERGYAVNFRKVNSKLYSSTSDPAAGGMQDGTPESRDSSGRRTWPCANLIGDPYSLISVSPPIANLETYRACGVRSGAWFQ
jgi:hypothetical protein